MAKIVLIAVFCILGATLIKGGFNKEEAIKDFLTKLDACNEEVGAAKSDIDEMLKKAPASSKEGKCLRACLMKKYGVMDGNGKFVKAVAMELSEKYTEGDAAKIKIADEVTNACEGISVSDDHCDASVEYMQCLMEQAKAHGIEKFEF